MKWLIPALLFPALTFAAQPSGPAGGQMDPVQYFQQSKQRMLPIIEKSLPAMQETKACLNKAEDQGAFQKCVEIMTTLDKEMRTNMGSAPGMNGSAQPAAKEPQKIEFNEQNKTNMLRFLERSILIGSAMKKCFSASEMPEQMQTCMQAEKTKQGAGRPQ
jgi:hypothetical protein